MTGNTGILNCILCFAECKQIAVPLCSPKLLELCCKYLHSSLVQESLLRQHNHNILPFCPKCLDSVVELGNLNDQFEFFQKKVSELVLILSLEILHRRGDSIRNQNRSTGRNSESDLVRFDVSALPNCDFKKSTTIPAKDIEISKNVDQHFFCNSEDYPEPLIIHPSTTPNFEVMYENIKVENEAQIWIEGETHDAVGTDDTHTDLLIETIKPKFSIGHTGDKLLSPIVKLQRLNFHGNDRRMILVKNDQKILNDPSGSRELKSQTVWTKSNFGGSFKIIDASKILPTEKCSDSKDSVQITCISKKNSNSVTSSIREISQHDDTDSLTQSVTNSANHSEEQICNQNQSTNKTFECLVCNETFSAEQELSLHSAIHSEKLLPKFNCEKRHGKIVQAEQHALKDKQRISTRCDLSNGSIKNTSERQYKCKFCDLRFKNIHRRTIHTRIHIGEKPYKCELCGKRFAVESNLKRHAKINHTEERPYKCELCDKVFAFKWAVSKHSNSHRKPHCCKICGKGFADKRGMERHIGIHTGEKPYKCEICGKGFVLESNLKRHCKSNIHHRKSYNCELCGKVFPFKNVLAQHRTIHHGGKPYKCEVCGKAFAVKNVLARHRKIHTGEKPYKCEVCGRSFSQKSLKLLHKCRMSTIEVGAEESHFSSGLNNSNENNTINKM